MIMAQDTYAVSAPPEGTTDSQQLARLAVMGVFSGSTIKAFTPLVTIGDKTTGIDPTDLYEAVDDVAKVVAGGKTAPVEKMLVRQLYSLDAMFNHMMQRAGRCESLSGMELLAKLALRAQSQARCTAEALAMIKNPAPYIRQANIANGHQQVNNTYAAASEHPDAVTDSRAREIETLSKRTIEGAEHGTRLDTGAQGKTGGDDPIMATVATKHRRKNGGR